MRKETFMRFLIQAFLLLMSCSVAFGQDKLVEILPFRNDSEEVRCRYDLELTVDGVKFEPKIDKSRFIVPASVENAKSIDVNLTCGDYALSFKSLKPRDFFSKDPRFQWRVGIDHFPFDFSQVPESIDKKVEEVQYIAFLPWGDVGTRTQVFIFKKEE